MDRQDIETRRADNQVWNGAENYGVRSDFHAFDPEGGADLYFNTVIGLVHHYYDFRRFKPLFNTFQSQFSGELYTDLFWLGLEGAGLPPGPGGPAGRWTAAAGIRRPGGRPGAGTRLSGRAWTTSAVPGSSGPWGSPGRRTTGSGECWTPSPFPRS